MTEDNKALLFTFLKSGMGFSASCEITGVHPREVSNLINEDKYFKREILKQMNNGKKAFAIISNQLLKEQKFLKWKAHNEELKDKIFNLVLWESYAKKENVNNKTIIEAVIKFKTFQEAATACGFESQEFANKIFSNPVLRRAIDVLKH